MGASWIHDLFDFWQRRTYPNSITSVGIFTRLENPYVSDFSVRADLQFCLLLECLYEFGILFEIFGPLYVERERQIIEHIKFQHLVVGPHVVEESLLVGDVVVVLQMVVNFYLSWIRVDLQVPFKFGGLLES